jgi:hypothetical protein
VVFVQGKSPKARELEGRVDVAHRVQLLPYPKEGCAGCDGVMSDDGDMMMFIGL